MFSLAVLMVEGLRFIWYGEFAILTQYMGLLFSSYSVLRALVAQPGSSLVNNFITL